MTDYRLPERKAFHSIDDLMVGDTIILHRVVSLAGVAKQPLSYRAEVMQMVRNGAKLRIVEDTGHRTWNSGNIKVVLQSNLDEGYWFEREPRIHRLSLEEYQFELVRDLLATGDHQDQAVRDALRAIDPDYILPPIVEAVFRRPPEGWQDGMNIGLTLRPPSNMPVDEYGPLHNSTVIAWGYDVGDDDDTLVVLALISASWRKRPGENLPRNYATFYLDITSSEVTHVEFFPNIVPATADYRDNRGMDY